MRVIAMDQKSFWEVGVRRTRSLPALPKSDVNQQDRTLEFTFPAPSSVRTAPTSAAVTQSFISFLFSRFTGLAASSGRNPKLKILLSIGGYLFGSKGFHPMVESSSSVLEFVKSVILFLRNHNFDGLDISWIYPSVKDNTHFTVLIHKLAEAFHQDFVKSTKERLLLTAGVSAGRQMIDNSYQIKELAKDLDFINLLSFDFHGSWEKPLVTGHNSPLRKGQLDRGTSSYYNVEYAVGYWIHKGMPAEKVVMGIPTYGRSFTLASAETAVGAPASGPGAAGPITKSSGFLAYYEICQFLQGARITRLQDQQVPYAVKGNQWVGYDDVESVEIKVQFLKNLNLGGAMIWSIDMDDFTGKFCSQGPYPLVQAVKRSLGSLER
ncbi:chitinase-3-like protein 2 isoform X2 [Moschus berezovskii]|uniref:chitinase-3-like protein 2 isoform X2 n=1 Tax=Moschus berezovskii TaxID=68408 RepID=UPI002443BB29|nr:chitinase-3-like protein 2 isoform X2 [Moschus berezovskii]